MSTIESTQAIATRMDAQRAQLHRQFVKPPVPQSSISEGAGDSMTASTAMQPYEPKSLLMKLLVANPQLIQRLLVLAATTALGARYSSWAMRLVDLFLATRRPR